MKLKTRLRKVLTELELIREDCETTYERYEVNEVMECLKKCPMLTGKKGGHV